jgi:hypothetical protein
MGAAILSGGRGGGDDAGGSRDAGASKDSGTTKGAGDAKADAGKPAAPAAKDAAAGPAASGASAKPSDDGKLNSTHPARDGRGAGNLRDAIARQRAAAAKKSGNSGAKKPAKAPRRGSR